MDEPIIGEIRKGRQLGHTTGSYASANYAWQPCQICLKPRWVEVRKGGKLKNLLCHHCSSKIKWSDPIYHARCKALMKVAHSNPEVRANHSKAAEIEFAKPEVIEKLSKSIIKSLAKPEYKAKIRSINSKPEAIIKRSNATRKNWENPEYRSTQTNRFKRQWANLEWKKKQSAILKISNNRPEVKEKLSNSSTERWKDPIYKERVARLCILALHNTPNKCEIKLGDILNGLYPNEWKYVGNGEVIIGGLNPDFVNINGKKQVIELFGDYWHSKEVVKNDWKRTVFGRITIFKNYGFKCLVIWERELIDSVSVINKIKEFANG